jgi:hypothetical protein
MPSANPPRASSASKGAKASACKPQTPIKKNHSTAGKKKGQDSDFAELDSLFRCLFPVIRVFVSARILQS